MVPFNILDISFNKIINTLLKLKGINFKILKYSFGIICCTRDIIRYLNTLEEKNKLLQFLNNFDKNDNITISKLKYIYSTTELDYNEICKSIINFELKTNNHFNDTLYQTLNKFVNNNKQSLKIFNKWNSGLGKGIIELTVLEQITKYKAKNRIVSTNSDIRKPNYFLNSSIKSISNYFIDEFKQLHTNFENILNKKEKAISSIVIVFRNKNYKLQYSIDDYILDLYFIDYKLAIECIEHNNNTDNEQYLKREAIIKMHLNCSFIRFNPSLKDFDIFKLIGTINIFMNRFDKT